MNPPQHTWWRIGASISLPLATVNAMQIRAFKSLAYSANNSTYLSARLPSRLVIILTVYHVSL